MTDQFEEWLEGEIKKSGDMLEITQDRFDDGIEQGYSNALSQYREFLKEQTRQGEKRRLELAAEYAKTHGGFVWTPPDERLK